MGQGQENMVPYFLSAGVVFIVVCPLIAGLRFVVRGTRKSRYGVDDWLMIPGTLLVIGCALCMIIGVAFQVFAYPSPPPSNPQDPSDSPSRNRTLVEQLEWAFYLMQILAMGCIKLSFVFFFRRIFLTGNERWSAFGIVTFLMIIVIASWTAAFLSWFLFSCASNFSGRWETVKTYSASCPTDVTSDLALAISDFLTDFMVMSLPVVPILRLRMSVKRKLAISGLFGLGALALAASVVRLAKFVWDVRLARGEVTDVHVDANLIITQSLYWSMIESGLAHIACCITTLFGLFRGRSRLSVFRKRANGYTFKLPDSKKTSSTADNSSAQRSDPAPATYLDKTAFGVNLSHMDDMISSEAYAFAETGDQSRRNSTIPPGAIRVEQSIERREHSL